MSYEYSFWYSCFHLLIKNENKEDVINFLNSILVCLSDIRVFNNIRYQMRNIDHNNIIGSMKAIKNKTSNMTIYVSESDGKEVWGNFLWVTLFCSAVSCNSYEKIKAFKNAVKFLKVILTCQDCRTNFIRNCKTLNINYFDKDAHSLTYWLYKMKMYSDSEASEDYNPPYFNTVYNKYLKMIR